MDARNVYTLLLEAAEKFGSAPALYEPMGGQKYRAWNWIEYRQAVEEIAAGLRCLGLRPGDIVGIDAETRLEFYLADLGVMVAGAVAAAVYTTYPPAETLKTFRACDARAIIVENPKVLGALLSAAERPLGVKWILLTGEADEAITLDYVRQMGANAITADPGLPGRLRAEVTPQDFAILYLTSGATGEPKMGLVTHAALAANVDMGPAAIPLGPDHTTIAFLPSAHITQRVAMELLPIRVGMPVHFSEGLSKLPHELKAVRPTFLVAPPRVWERMYASICTEIGKKGAVTQRIFYGALGLGLEASKRRSNGKPVPGWLERSLRIADRVVFSKIKERLGGRLQFAVSGAAPLGKDLADFYASIGMPLYEGYGLTEGGIVALNPMDRPKSGSIGKALEGVNMRLGDDGELLIHSPTLFSGYYKDPAATEDVLRDGWLHTGDVAEFDGEGYIYITGRKKELLVASSGKKIFPARIETLLKMEPLVNQVLLLGDKMPYVAALFTLNAPAAESLKGMEEFKGRPAGEIVAAAPVVAEMKKMIARVNKQLAPFEQIRRYHILERDFTIEDGELTPTMKVRRARVLENHRRIISTLFLGKDSE
ncbi:MAG: AMP-dependent synthetase/ligase [Bryobacteraceae bacterium]